MERNIFTYFNGTRDVKVDPMVLEYAWRDAVRGVDIESVMSRFFGPDFLHASDEDFAKLDVPDDVLKMALDRRDEATAELIPVLCKTFGVKTLAEDQEDGMTYAEILRAYTAWMGFVTAVKKNTDSSADSPPPGEPQSLPMTMNGNSDTTTTPASSSASAPSPSPQPSATL
jgi:hypothetical protein